MDKAIPWIFDLPALFESEVLLANLNTRRLVCRKLQDVRLFQHEEESELLTVVSLHICNKDDSPRPGHTLGNLRYPRDPRDTNHRVPTQACIQNRRGIRKKNV